MRGAYIVDRPSCSKDLEGVQVKAAAGKQFDQTLREESKWKRKRAAAGVWRSGRCLCGRREQNLRKIVTKNYSLPAVNIPPTITICASRSSMFPEGLKHVCMIQVFPPSRSFPRLTSHNL